MEGEEGKRGEGRDSGLSQCWRQIDAPAPQYCWTPAIELLPGQAPLWVIQSAMKNDQSFHCCICVTGDALCNRIFSLLATAWARLTEGYRCGQTWSSCVTEHAVVLWVLVCPSSKMAQFTSSKDQCVLIPGRMCLLGFYFFLSLQRITSILAFTVWSSKDSH